MLPGNADGDARVNELLDPLQGSLAIREAKPVIFRGDLQALAPKEAISAFDTAAVQLALLAAPDAQPISVQDLPAVGPSAEVDQMVFFIIFAARCVAFPVQDRAAVAIFHSGCDPPWLNCF